MIKDILLAIAGIIIMIDTVFLIACIKIIKEEDKDDI